MNQVLMTVWDSAAMRYLDPFVAPTVAFGIRGFTEAVNTEGHQFNKFPEDYTLFKCGEFDPTTGKLVSIDPVSLGVAVTFIATPDIPRAVNDA